MNDNKIKTSLEIKQVLSEPYKYGFQTNIKNESFPFEMIWNTSLCKGSFC